MKSLTRNLAVMFLSTLLLTTVVSAQEIAVIETKFGKIGVEFFEDKAPGHVKNFKDLAKKGFYDGTIFHRVIPGSWFRVEIRIPKVMIGRLMGWVAQGIPSKRSLMMNPM